MTNDSFVGISHFDKYQILRPTQMAERDICRKSKLNENNQTNKRGKEKKRVVENVPSSFILPNFCAF